MTIEGKDDQRIMGESLQYGVLHLIGGDRVGILQRAAAFVKDRGGSTEEGISHSLESEAVVLLVLSGPSESLDSIERDTPKLGEALKLLALFSRVTERNAVRREALPLTLRVSSPDFAGLLACLTQFFSSQDLPIVAHHTLKSTYPQASGIVTYRHRFTVLLPPHFDRKKFIAGLDQLAQEHDFIRDDISHSDYY